MFFRNASLLLDSLWKAPKERKGAFAPARFLILYAISQTTIAPAGGSYPCKASASKNRPGFSVQLSELK